MYIGIIACHLPDDTLSTDSNIEMLRELEEVPLKQHEDPI